ncbi:MAG TPA: CPBP family intramembrane glutamic endopeptidase [Candidatus Polarisedimenticolaceae bacterium]|nr:CPBP family intramembrane glutamic endopeptidase [Candidatus Polarisedimenticolaceae bacterium]
MPIGFAGIYHLALFGLLIPFAAVRSARRIDSRRLPPKAAHFISTVVTLLVFFGLSLLVSVRERIVLFPRAAPPLWTITAGGAVLVALVGLMRPIWKSRVAARARKIWLFMPRTPRERALWVACSLAAGLAEEVTYRGVMYVLLWRLTGHPLPAVLIASIVFGVSHWLQGWKGMSIITSIALAMHGLVWISGSLYVAIAVHALYDVAAGLFYAKYGDELGYPLEPLPPPAPAS